MASSSGPPEVPIVPVQLNGWKDIAAYLGRSVRTVQRWEKDFGLPVRRFGVSKPESVFALPREIDAWLETAQGISARSGAGPAQDSASEPPPQESIEPLFPRRWLTRMSTAAIVVALIVVAAWAVWVTSQIDRHSRRLSATLPSAPADWRIDLDSLIVSDSHGAVLWRHRFPFDLAADQYEAPNPPRKLLGGVADLDGDGQREVWLVTRPARLPAPHESALYLFNSDGSVRWRYSFSGTVRFGQGTFGPSWILHKVFVTPDPGGGPGRAIWAVVYDAALFPSLLQRLDPLTGKPLGAYWSNGYIISLALGLADNRRRLFVGACDNEHRAGSLAVLDAMSPSGSAPAELEKYRCTSCPVGDAEMFLVFPKPARFGHAEATGFVERIEPLADGGVIIGVQHATAGDLGNAVAIHTFDPALNPRSVDTADAYVKVYQALVSQGLAPRGAATTVDPAREFFPILRWNSATRRFVRIPAPVS